MRLSPKAKKLKEYSDNPKTLGEHLKRRRKVLGFWQKDVGTLLKVDAFTVLNWEKDKTIPATRYLPRIIGFLGYDPFPAPGTLGGRIVACRRQLGMPRKKLAQRLCVDEGALKKWEEDRKVPRGRWLAKLLGFLDRATL